MKKTLTAFTALALLVTVPAFAESLGEKTGVNSTLDIAPTTADFVSEAAISDMFEIESSKLAEERSDDATKAFAKKMIADHTKTSSELKPLAQAANAVVPADLDSAHKDMLAKLQGLKGGDFTKQYHDDQARAHKQAVSLYERYAKGGENAGLKTFAHATLPTLQEHEKMAETLDQGS